MDRGRLLRRCSSCEPIGAGRARASPRGTAAASPAGLCVSQWGGDDQSPAQPVSRMLLRLRFASAGAGDRAQDRWLGRLRAASRAGPSATPHMLHGWDRGARIACSDDRERAGSARPRGHGPGVRACGAHPRGWVEISWPAYAGRREITSRRVTGRYARLRPFFVLEDGYYAPLGEARH
jgi:hypothetical protein